MALSDKLSSINYEISKNIGYIKAKGFELSYSSKNTTLIRRDYMIEKKGKYWCLYPIDDETGIADKHPEAKESMLINLIKSVL